MIKLIFLPKMVTFCILGIGKKKKKPTQFFGILGSVAEGNTTIFFFWPYNNQNFRVSNVKTGGPKLAKDTWTGHTCSG